MRITSWIDSLTTRWQRTRSFRRAQRPSPAAHRPRQAPAAAAERLEDRTLLSVTSLFFNGDLTVVSDADDAIVIREDPVQAGRVEILVGNPVGGTINYVADTSVGALDADTVQTILVRGGDDGNTIDLGDAQGLGGVDSAVYTSLTSVVIEGGNGDDTITGTINFTDVISGGDGDDVITVGAGSATVDGGDGNDAITGGPASDVISGGDGNDTISGLAGADTIDAGNGHDEVDGGDELAGPGDRIIGGHGHDTLRGGGGNDWINGNSGNDEIYGGAGSDTMHGGSGSDLMQGGADDDTINGQGYDDTIQGNGGSDRINGHWGHDYIDGDDDSGSATAGNDTLLGGAGRDTLLGNLGDDNLKGQGGSDTLIGGPGLDKLNGGDSHDLLRGFQQQIVRLDFDSQTDPLAEHIYTAAERTSIQSRLESDFAAFDISFTESVPNTKDLYLQNGAYITVVFNMAPLGIGPGLGGAGEASAYDFRNVDLGGSVSVDVLGSNGLLDGTGQPTSTSANIIAASAYATAHGLGSLFGLRDVDSFGPISGTVGILDPPGAASFSPAFPGPMNATETVNHLMASAGLLGAGNFDVTADLFLSERSAIKLAFNETGRLVVEQAAWHGSLTPSGSQPMTLRALSVPNTLESGANADRTLNVEAAAIIGGQVGVAGEVDVYSFEGTGGQVVSIEVLSEWLTRVTAPVDTLVRVYDSSGAILPYHSSSTSATDIAINDGFDDGSGQPDGDPVLLNLTLPTTGNATDTYYIEVSEPDANGVFVLPTDGSNQIVELDPVTGVELNRFDLPTGETSAGQAALAFDSAGERLFFMNNASRYLYKIDANDGSVIDSTLITSPIASSPQAFDGLAYDAGLVYILDIEAETIPGQAEDQNANPSIPQIVDPPEILVFDVLLDVLVPSQFLNLVGTGEGVPLPGANPAGTFIDITGGLAMIAPASTTPRLLLLDSAGQSVHEINPEMGASMGASMLSYTPLSTMAGNMDAVGAVAGQVWLGGAPGEDRIEIFDRGDAVIDRTLGLTPNPPPSYGLTAIGADDTSVPLDGIGGYELFVTKVDFSPLATSTALGDTLLGGSGNDTMWGGSAADVLKGGSGADSGSGLGGGDYINAGSGNDTMRGGLDDDTLLGGSGQDKLYGDAGDDTLDGQGGSDTLDGNGGDDLLRWRIGNGSDVMDNSAGSARFEALGSGAADSLSVSKTSGNRPKLTVLDGINTVRVSNTIWRTDILAGGGNDQLVIGSLVDVGGTLLVVNGEGGRDTISAAGVRIGEVRLRLDGGDDNDTLTGSLDGDTIWGGEGNDRADGGRGNDTILGGGGDDDLDGQDDDDLIFGNDGNDTLQGGNGHDNLSGNSGFDTLIGGFGRDTLSGGEHDDVLTGSQDDDTLFGNEGQDSLYGGTGDDYLNGGLNDDRLYGNYGDDTIGGGDGNDLLEASHGDDILNGGDGDDTLNGGDGFDGLSGHDGNDVINGGGQDDTILGGNGHDSLSGGGGRDIVLGGDGNDTISGQGAQDTLAGNEGADVINGLASEINENFSFYASWVDSV